MAWTYTVGTADGKTWSAVADDHEEQNRTDLIRRVLVLKKDGEVVGQFQAYMNWTRVPYADPPPRRTKAV